MSFQTNRGSSHTPEKLRNADEWLRNTKVPLLAMPLLLSRRPGIDVETDSHLLHLCPGTKEDTVSCREFIQDMKRRGLCDPLLVTTDGAAGLIKAVENASRVHLASVAWCTRCATRRVTDEQLWPQVKGRSRQRLPSRNRREGAAAERLVREALAEEVPHGGRLLP